MSLAVRSVSVAGYRSLRSIRFPVGALTVFVGANGVGKTNLYRALQLVRAAADDALATEIAGEGGLASTLWAGPRRKGEPARVRLEVELGVAERATVDYRYEAEIGAPPPFAAGAFPSEAQLKLERASHLYQGRSKPLLERKGPGVWVWAEGLKVNLPLDVTRSETALGRLREPARFPDLDLIRRTLLDWRFHHDLRTDAGSALRRPCLAVTSPTLASDGANLASVFATLVHIREDTVELDAAVADAFPGAKLVVPMPERTASFGMIFPEHPGRVFEAAELSDGTLRFLALTGVLLAYRLPGFIALNEPEASLHPDLLAPLARLIAQASKRTQVWLVTHSERLAEALRVEAGVAPLTVVKQRGATWVEGLKLFGAFADEDDEKD